MFDHPPHFILPVWNALANLTDWFNWNALSAIGTVGALWFAVVQSSRSARLERTRVDGTLTTLIGLIEPLCDALARFEPRKGDMLTRSEVRELLRARDLVDRAIDGIRMLPHSNVAETGVSVWVNGLSYVLPLIRERLPANEKQRVRVDVLDFPGWEYIYEADEFIGNHLDRIRYGRIGVHLHRLYYKVSMRIAMWGAARRMKKWGTNRSD